MGKIILGACFGIIMWLFFEMIWLDDFKHEMVESQSMILMKRCYDTALGEQILEIDSLHKENKLLKDSIIKMKK